MEEAIRKRINLVIDESKMSQTAFADAINVVQVTLNRQLKGQRGVSLDTISSILQHQTDLSAEWLLRGEGNMYKTTELPTVDVSSEDSINHSVEIARLVKERNELIDEIEDLKKKCAKLEELVDRLSKENIAIAAQRDMAKDLLREYMMGEAAQKVG